MTQETNPTYDVCLADPVPNGRLKNIGRAYPTLKGTGIRFTLKVALAEGAQLVLLPSRSRADTPPAGDDQN